MTREEHLLVILGEECNEVAKETSKALRFGLDDKGPNQDLTNRKKIATEFNDLFAVVSMCLDAGILSESDIMVTTEMEAKKQKVEKYLKYSKSVGKAVKYNQFFICARCGSKIKTMDGSLPITCVQPFPHRIMGICGSGFRQINEEDYNDNR